MQPSARVRVLPLSESLSEPERESASVNSSVEGTRGESLKLHRSLTAPRAMSNLPPLILPTSSSSVM